MSISLYLVNNDYKKDLCINISKKIAKVCCSIKDDDRKKCIDLVDNYKKFCMMYK